MAVPATRYDIPAKAAAGALRRHDELMFIVERIRIVAHWDARFLPEGHVRKILRDDLEHLIPRLRAYFAYEENGGYLQEVLDKRPTLASQVDGLLAQHNELLDQLGALLARSGLDGAGRLEVQALKEALLGALALLQDHEHAENELLQMVLCNDMGSQD